MPRTSRNRPTSQRASQSISYPHPPSRSSQHGGNQAMVVGLSTTVENLNTLTIKTLKQHLASRKLPTTDAKAILVHRLYNAIHGESSQTMQTENPTATLRENPTSIPVTVSTTSYTITQPTETANQASSFTPNQISAMIQMLSQALQTRASQPDTSAIPSQLLGSTLPIFSTAPQHNRAVTTQSIINPSISLQPNDDALSTASSVSPNAGINPADPLAPIISQSLPPVPVTLQQRILKGEYIDFSTLLPEVMFSVATSTPSPNASRSTGHPPRITSFSTWLDAWNIYIATVVAHNPGRASELLGYQRLIHSASKHFNTASWLKYDAQFRTLAASNPQLRWDSRHPDLWLDSLAIQTSSNSATRSRWPCTYCGSTYHFPDLCPRCPFRASQQDSSFNSTQRGPGPNPPQRDPGSRSLTCRDFNNGTCNRNPCRYQHNCYACGSPNHPAYKCNGQPTSSH